MELPKEFIEHSIDRGDILLSDMFKNIDHAKFFVVIGVNKDYIAGFFFINSNINIHLEGKQEQLAMQYPLRKKDYDFLRYDSFLSATTLMKMPCSDIADSIANGSTKIISKMKQEHMDELLEKARTSILFSKQQIRQFFY